MIIKQGINELREGLGDLALHGSSDALVSLANKVIKYSKRNIYNTLNSVLPPVNIQEAEKIIFLESTSSREGGGLGDSIFTLPGLEDVAQHFQQKIDIMTIPERAPIFSNLSYINNIVHPHNIDEITKSTTYDLVFALYPSFSRYMAGWKLNGGKQIKVVRGYRGEFLKSTDDNGIKVMKKSFQKLFSYEELSTNDTPKICLDENLVTWAETEKITRSNEQAIGISISYKDYLKNYKQLNTVISLLSRTYPDLQFVLVGGCKHEEIEKRENIKDYSNTLSYEQTLAILQQCKLAIGFDGGILNGAIAVGTPTHIVFNIIPSKKIIPHTSTNTTVLDVGCELSYNCHTSTRKDHNSICRKTKSKNPACLDSLDPIKVYNSIAAQIDNIISKSTIPESRLLSSLS